MNARTGVKVFAPSQFETYSLRKLQRLIRIDAGVRPKVLPPLWWCRVETKDARGRVWVEIKDIAAEKKPEGALRRLHPTQGWKAA